MPSLKLSYKNKLLQAAVLYLFATLTASAPPNPQQHSPKPPADSVRKVLDANFPDPSLLQDGNAWFAYGTNNGHANVQIATSPDFAEWTLTGRDALPHPGAWADHEKPSVWAPSVIKNDNGDFVMYYSARSAKSPTQHCIGIATAKSAWGPFVARPATAFPCDIPAGGAIDASGFRDADGSRYVLYKVDGNSVGHGGHCGNANNPVDPTPLMLQKVAGDGMALIGPPVQILDRSGTDGPLIEAPSLVRTGDGKYVLFFSSNCFLTPLYGKFPSLYNHLLDAKASYVNLCGSDISYAMADHVAGPYVKAGPLAVTGTDGLVAPGGASVDGEGKRMVFHAGQGTRKLYTAQISIDTHKRVVSF